jgi:hypothetical protein
VKNQANTYGYYLTEDSDTIEFRGDFEQNVIFLPTKNPDEQLNYKVFVSPKKAINFGIQIVGGTNPNVVYIPQHIYKDLQIAYNENNPYYTIKDITIIKLDFTDSGNSLIKYLKTKYETTKDTELSKIGNAGSTGIKSYAGFDASGNPIDEDILKQILYLYEEQNDIIFVDKDDELVTEDIVKNRAFKSNRILGDFTYISNYFDSSGKFKESLLNSKENIKVEDATIKSILQLPDFLKDTADKTLTDVNSIYKNNITLEEKIVNAPKVLGLAMNGLSKVAPLFSGVRDKVSQLKAQNAQKKLAEAKALGGALRGQLEGGVAGVRGQLEGQVAGVRGQLEGQVAGVRGQATDAINNVKGLFSTSKALVSQYKTSVSLKAEGGLSNQFTIPSANGLSNKFAIPSSGVSNPFNIPGTSGESNPFNIPGATGTSNRFNIPGTSGTSNPFRIGGSGTSNPFSIPGATGTSNPFNIPSLGTSNSFNIPSIGTSNSFSIPGTSGVSNPFRLGGSGTSNPFNIPGTSGESNPFRIGGATGTSNPFRIGGTSNTSNPFRIGGTSNTSNPFRIGGSAESLKAANSDFLKF